MSDLAGKQDKTIPGNHSSHLISETVRQKLAAGEKPNRLLDEKSPYLLQHAFNPVDWYPWGEEAFAKARDEGKIIFLSIGYSTCYWCHVMEREVFEDSVIAALMNELVVCIKVDREERPDVDRVYMSAVQAMTGSGGWPMSVFLTPGLKPFYGATYIPPVSRNGRPGFPDLLEKIVGLWKSEPERVRASGDELVAFLKNLETAAAPGALDPTILDRAFENFNSAYDSVHAGFGGGPKFPRPSVFSFLLRYHHRTGNARALEITARTLKKMAGGGMYDHVGGGFHRYSVDGEWRVPHFEKMLYDQAQLVVAYTEAFQVTRDPFFREVAIDILRYVTTTMTDPGGGFYSAEDAESATGAPGSSKEEGAYYVWTSGEIGKLLRGDDADIFRFRYGVAESGNAPHDPQNVFTGKNILYTEHSLEETARRFGKNETEIRASLSGSRSILLEARNARSRPYLDDKIISAWNGLMISAFARAHQVFGDDNYRGIASRAASFVQESLIDKQNGNLYRRYRGGEARYEGGLQDYAFLVQGLLDLYESSFDYRHLRAARDLTERQIELFTDGEHGGFFDTPAGESSLILRTREEYDGAEPSGNSVAAMNLLRLSRITGNEQWQSLAEKTISSLAGNIEKRPDSAPQLLAAVDWASSQPGEIVIAGKPGNADTRRLLNEVYSRFLPRKILLLADGGQNQGRLQADLGFLAAMGPAGGNATAYLCENYACRLPTTDPEALGEMLDGAPETGLEPPSGGK